MAELQAAMSSREFAGWMAYAGIVPMPAERADLRAATVAALVAETNRDRKRRRKPYTIGEFCELFSGQSLRGVAEKGAGTAPLPDAERKSWELWANLKAWAMRQPRGSKGSHGGLPLRDREG